MSDFESIINSLGTGYKLPEGLSVPVSMQAKDLTFVRAIVKYVDLERFTMTCDVQYKTKDVITEIPIAMPFAGISSFISGMPEKGSIVILMALDNIYFPIAYLPTYMYALEQKQIQMWPDSVQAMENDFFYRHRSLRSGEINIGSSEGAELLLSHNALLENSYGDNILLRSSDHAIISTSLNNCIFSSGVWLNAGVIQRNALVTDNRDEGQYAYEHTLRDGKIIYQLKPEDTGALSRYYSEYLLEVEESGSPELPLNSINDQRDIDSRTPTAIFSLGNFVGNNPSKNTYGKMLGLSFFKDHNATDGAFSFKALVKDQPERHGLAIALYKPERANYEQGAIFAIDKEGHFYQYIPATSGGGLPGTGRSMSIVARGNKKEIWGADSILNNSWDTVLKGGLKWIIGSHNINDYDLRNTSMDIVTDGKVYFQYGTNTNRSMRDFDQPKKLIQNVDKYRKIEKVGGYERKEITGSRETIIEGGDFFKIKGMKKESVNGAYNTFVGTNRNINVGDVYSLKVANEGQESFGNRTITCNKGSHKTTISFAGNIEEKINILGNKITSIKAGSITESILFAGNRIFKTLTGNYKVNVLAAGNVTHKTVAGNIVGETKAGKMNLKSSLGMDIKTLAAVKVQGLKVNLKTPVPMGKVVTKLTSVCFVTGVPNPGHPMITA